MADRFFYGGQAVLEGVMMRGRRSFVTAVRRPNGEVTVDAEPLNRLYTGVLRKIPIVRGVIALLEAMVLGIKTLLFSANVSLEEEKVEVSGGMVWRLLSVSLALTVSLFFLAPMLLANVFDFKSRLSPVGYNILEGFIRIAIFTGYLALISVMPDMRRVFAYHGAEHKTINAYEDGAPLDTPHIRKYSTAHVRCGTSFLFAVMVIAILVLSIFGRPGLFFRIVSRVLVFPVIAGISYEITLFGGKHAKNPVVRMVLWPGLLLQKLTTREPDDSQIEVAAEALKRAVEIDRASQERLNPESLVIPQANSP